MCPSLWRTARIKYYSCSIIAALISSEYIWGSFLLFDSAAAAAAIAQRHLVHLLKWSSTSNLIGSVALAMQCFALYLVSIHNELKTKESISSQIKISNKMLARVYPTSKTSIVREEKDNE